MYKKEPNRDSCVCVHIYRNTPHALYKISRYKMLAVSALFNCSCNLARLNSGVTLFQGSSTLRPLSSSR